LVPERNGSLLRARGFFITLLMLLILLVVTAGKGAF